MRGVETINYATNYIVAEYKNTFKQNALTRTNILPKYASFVSRETIISLQQFMRTKNYIQNI